MSMTRLAPAFLACVLCWTQCSAQSSAGTETYTYDALGRLSTVTNTNATTISYSYDAAGNWLQVQATDSSPPGAPGVPTFSNVTLTSMTVSWTAATDNIAVASYEYQVNSGPWTNVGKALTVNLSGLALGTQYTVSVRARDTDGTPGPASKSSRWTPPPAPGTPTVSSIAATSASASWAAPSGTVTSYGYSTNGGTSWTSVGNVLTTSITGLASATSYTVNVQASNPGGTSPASAAASFMTLPGSVGSLSISGITATAATVSWSAVSGAIIRYEYSLNGGSWISVGSTLSVTLSGFSAGSSNTIQVHAVDTTGAGAASSATFSMPPPAPGTPSVTAITAHTASVSWTAASGTVTGYSYSLNGGSTWTSVGTALTASLTGLTPATTYTVQVQATNAGATGPSSSASFTSWYQVTTASGGLYSGSYTIRVEPGVGPPYTDWVLQQAYGSGQFIWDITSGNWNGTGCPTNGGNSLTTSGYVRIAGGCEIDASPSVYDK